MSEAEETTVSPIRETEPTTATSVPLDPAEVTIPIFDDGMLNPPSGVIGLDAMALMNPVGTIDYLAERGDCELSISVGFGRACRVCVLRGKRMANVAGNDWRKALAEAAVDVLRDS